MADLIENARLRKKVLETLGPKLDTLNQECDGLAAQCDTSLAEFNRLRAKEDALVKTIRFVATQSVKTPSEFMAIRTKIHKLKDLLRLEPNVQEISGETTEEAAELSDAVAASTETLIADIENLTVETREMTKALADHVAGVEGDVEHKCKFTLQLRRTQQQQSRLTNIKQQRTPEERSLNRRGTPSSLHSKNQNSWGSSDNYRGL